MRYFDEYGNELLESEIDLTLGSLSEGTAIKVDAEPIDNVTKFAWTDDDYEVVQYYHLYPVEAKPTAPRNIIAGEYITANGVLYKATSNIPNGEPIITGQNAIETTVEEQLAELMKGA